MAIDDSTPPPQQSPAPPAPSRPHPSGTATIVPITVALAVALAAIVAWHADDPWRFLSHRGDLTVYQLGADRLLKGKVPYRDFVLEYPPAAIVAFLLPTLFLGGAGVVNGAATLAYASAFGNVMVAMMAGVMLVASRIRAAMGAAAPQGAVASAVVMAAAALLVAPMLLYRFDAYPALLTTLALWATVRRRPATAGALLAVAVLTKLYPAVLVPLILAFHLAQGDRRGALRFLIGGVAATVAIVAPTTAIAPGWVAEFVGYHMKRGVQLESLPASLWLMAARLGWVRVSGGMSYGAYHVTAPGLAWAARASFLAMLAALVVTQMAAYRRMCREHLDTGAASARTLVLAAFLSVLAFAVFNKVLSPQYLVWLIPMVGLIRGRMAATMLVACALTSAVFPMFYVYLIWQRTPMVLVLAARNAALLAAFAMGLRELLGRSPDGSPRPAA